MILLIYVVFLGASGKPSHLKAKLTFSHGITSLYD